MQALVNKYTFERKLGKGNFAEVFLLRKKSDGIHFACKQIHKSSPGISSADTPECQVLRLLKRRPHPNVIQLEEVLEDKNCVYIIQEYAPRGDLLTWLMNNPMNEEEAKRVMAGIVAGVNHIHSQRVAHRDLKLENILLSADLTPKIADFGFAIGFFLSQPITSFCGSPMYCAPELITKNPYLGPDVDVWACGVILFSLIWRRFPFPLVGQGEGPEKEKEGLQRMLRSVVYFDVDLPEGHGSDDVRELVRAMLERQPLARITISDVICSPWFDGSPINIEGDWDVPKASSSSNLESAESRLPLWRVQKDKVRRVSTGLKYKMKHILWHLNSASF